jgi:rhamnosyltransferase subunit B
LIQISGLNQQVSKHIVLASWGSYGDLHPFLAVALCLKNRGHRVTVATASSYRGEVEREGLGFAAIRPDLPAPSATRSVDPKMDIEVLLNYSLLPHLKDSYADLLAACQDADLLVGHILSFAVPLVAGRLRVPWLTMVLQPMSFYSNHDPPFIASDPWLYPFRRLRPWPYSILSALRTARTRHWAEPIHRLRRELCLPPAGNSLADCWRSPFGTLAAFSGEFAHQQPDWPQPGWVTGFAHYDAGQPVSPELQHFLSKQGAPIVFTLGDVSSRAPGNFFRVSLSAVRQLGCRAVFLTGRHARISLPEFPPEQIFIAQYAPYSQVFPHAAAIVHAGGIGTIALALKACRPMLLVPTVFDQADNARRARKMRVARILDRARYTSGTVCRELRELLSNPDYARHAADIGTRVDAEDGAAAACERIENVLATQSCRG